MPSVDHSYVAIVLVRHGIILVIAVLLAPLWLAFPWLPTKCKDVGIKILRELREWSHGIPAGSNRGCIALPHTNLKKRHRAYAKERGISYQRAKMDMPHTPSHSRDAPNLDLASREAADLAQEAMIQVGIVSEPQWPPLLRLREEAADLVRAAILAAPVRAEVARMHQQAMESLVTAIDRCDVATEAEAEQHLFNVAVPQVQEAIRRDFYRLLDTVEGLRRRFRRMARSLVASVGDDGEEILNDTCAALMKNIRNGTRPIKIDDYFRLILVRKAHKFRQEGEWLRHSDADVAGQPGPSAAWDDPTYDDGFASQLLSTLKLSTGERQVLALKVDELTNAEIARRLGVASSTVGRRLRSIRCKAQAILERRSRGRRGSFALTDDHVSSITT